MGDRWFYLDSGRVEPALNMAVDEALLEWAAALGRPVLRTYGWNGPAATFGYFQRIAEIEALTPLRPLIRRPTGGGLVPHDADWTYSVVVPPGHVRYGLRAVDSYRQLHEWIQAALGRCGVMTELAPCCDPSGPGCCFVGAEQNDLLWEGRKIAGAAQRRNRLGLLIQGSVQSPLAGLDRGAWERSLREVTPGTEWEPLPLESGWSDRAQRLAQEKYRRPEYNARR